VVAVGCGDTGAVDRFEIEYRLFEVDFALAGEDAFSFGRGGYFDCCVGET